MLIVQEAVHVCGTGYIGELFALSAYFYSEPKTCLKNKSIKRKKKKRSTFSVAADMNGK